MKKVTLAIAMAALVIFAGCKKDSETKGTTLKASIEQNKGDGSKTSLNPTNGAILWTAGDKILVNNGTASATFTLSNGAGSASGTFTASGEFELGENNVAVYPYTATINGNNIGVTLPATQTLTTSGTFGNGANPMLAVSTDDNLTFTSLCGGLGISLTGNDIDITAIEIISANADEKLNGAFECTTDSPTLVASAGNSGTNRIMLECTTTLTETPQEFYIVLPVGVLANGFTMNLYDGGEEPIFSKSTESTQLQVALNTVKTMNAVEVTTIPEGAINGLFTINEAGDQVYFSKGNLQYTKSTGIWSFMEHQYDIVETHFQNVGEDYADQDVVSLFGWGTSGYNHGATYYQPWSTTFTYYGYYAYGNYIYNLQDQTGQADWGYNAISNGGNAENSGWRTLMQPEWDYVLNTRTTTSGIRWAMATLNGIGGILLLPDDWTDSIYTLNDTNGGNCGSNVINADDWANMFEANGAVFLPQAGVRQNGSEIYVMNGHYWTASTYDNLFAYYVALGYEQLHTDYTIGRFDGLSVRLVRNAE